MNVSQGWDNPEQTIIRVTLFDKWTWGELYEVNQRTVAMLRASDHTVHIMIDYTQTSDLPLGGIMHARNIMKDYPSTFGALLVVTQNTLVQRMANMFHAVYPSKSIYVIPSLEEAYRIAAEYKA